ncbi:MAG: hypothetical protein ABIP90_10930 [Vicinamibacterales bacterium]
MSADESGLRRRLGALGDEIEAQWCSENYAEEKFPELAANALRRADLPSTLRLGDLLRWSLETSRLPVQRDIESRFGDPALTLFAGPRFNIDVYVWFTGTTALHQHGFAGAFQVLQGSSIHADYAFTPARDVSPYFRFGHLSLRGCELLEKGAIEEILPGNAYIHRLFHLDHPSASLVVRTASSPGHQPQFSYLSPCIAIDPFFEEATTTKRLQCLQALYRSLDPGSDEATVEWLARADIHTAFQILSMVRLLLGRSEVERVFGVGSDDGRFRRLIDVARARHGDAVARFEEVFTEQERHDQLVSLRGSITDPEHRFFLALLLNVDDRDAILALVRQRFPDADPREKVLEWSGALARTRVMGAALPNALGIAGFDDFDLMILEQLLADATDAEVLATLAPGDVTADASRQLKARLTKLRTTPVLRPLLNATAT